MDINDDQKKNTGTDERQQQDPLRDAGGIEHNNDPQQNKQEAYVKEDQQSDLSYGRNNSRNTDPSQDQQNASNE